MTALKLCVLGPSGRMGRQVLDLAEADARVRVASIAEAAGSPLIGTELAGTQVTADLDVALSPAEVYIDFTVPAATTAAARASAQSEAPAAAIIGTTGLHGDALAAIDALARVAPVLVAPNFSLGVNVLLALAERAARALSDSGDEFDMEVLELHHKRKRDAPSGTAIALGQALARGRGIDYDSARCYARDGDIGPRPEGEIGVAALRGGDIAGEHTAYLIGELERIEITHRAASRSIFAAGALTAARWIRGRAPGRYSMADVLGL